jgi:uncharacterized membrane protein YfcA
MGHVDKKLGFFMLFTALLGIQLAAYINTTLFHFKGHSKGSSAAGVAGDLYISSIFIFVLSIVSITILYDFISSGSRKGGASKRISAIVSNFSLPPMIKFPVSDITVSFWIISSVGLATGYLAGTIGVGGFIGVPAMIYIFGVPTRVAAGTELFLAVFMGAWGAINYAWAGFVDIRLVLLLYTGSLFGIQIGVLGTKVVKEKMIRLVTGIIILLCVSSRVMMLPIYLRKIGWIDMNTGLDVYFQFLSKTILFMSGIAGIAVILTSVAKGYMRQRKVLAGLSKMFN